MKETVKYSLEKSFSDQIQIFEFNLDELHHDDDPEIIHQIRLSLKRIRSVEGFMEYVSPSHPVNIKNTRRLNKIFELSGHVRDNQVQLQDLRHLQQGLMFNFTQYEKYLKKRINDADILFRKKIHQYDSVFLRKLYRDFIGFLYSRTERDLKKCYHDILAEKHSMLTQSLRNLPESTKALHQIRQNVKDYLNLVALLDTGKSPNGKLSFKQLKRLDHELGRWHDLVNTQHSLKSFFKKNIGLMDKKEEYREIWTFIEEDISLSREKIDDLLRQDVADSL